MNDAEKVRDEARVAAARTLHESLASAWTVYEKVNRKAWTDWVEATRLLEECE